MPSDTTSSPVVPQKKGLSFLALKDYVIHAYGLATWDRVLPPEDYETVLSIVGVGWYPLAMYGRVVRAIDSKLGAGDLRTLIPMIHFEADRHLTGIHRMLLKLVQPAFVITKMGDLWSRYNSTGRLVVRLAGERAVEGTIHDWSDDQALCLCTQFYCERALQIVGARGVRMTHPRCRSRGDSHCLIRGTWDSRA